MTNLTHTPTPSTFVKGALCFVFFITAALTHAREIHVSKSGNDSNPGTAGEPYLTISKAAEVANAGDTVLVHEGTYREQITPANGGTPTNRIVYQAVDRNEVIIKGSEAITGWTPRTDLGANVWSVTIPDSYFGDTNPYRVTIGHIDDSWLNYGAWHSPGMVYFNETPYIEVRDGAVATTTQSWEIVKNDSSVELLANFGGATPDSGAVEINVRSAVFQPADNSDLNYITVDGFRMMQCASTWVSPATPTQKGMIAPLGGSNWIIENNYISDSRCVGIVLGRVSWGTGTWGLGSWGEFGSHIVRNNIIERCGEAGIAGLEAPTLSLIEGNSITNIGFFREFGGYEVAGIKFHQATDVTIKDNIISKVFREAGTRAANYGIWIDYSNQGTRITGNVIHGAMSHSIMLEHNHGPVLVDNNVLNRGIRSNTRNVIYAHNLFYGFNYSNHGDDPDVIYNLPHSRDPAGSAKCYAYDNKWFNNIFDDATMDKFPYQDGTEFDYNAFYNNSILPAFDIGSNNLVDPTVDSNITITPSVTIDGKDYLRVEITVSSNLLNINSPLIDSDTFGVFPLVNQKIEDKDGNSITLDTDINGTVDTTRIPGPFSDLQVGVNTYLVPLPTGPGATGPADENTPTTIEIIAPTDADQFTASENIMVSVDASDNSGIERVLLWTKDKLTENSPWVSNGAGTLSDSLYHWNLDPLADGEYFIRTTAFSNDTDPSTGLQERAATQVTVYVVSGEGTTFAAWISDYPGVGGLTGINDDPDGDGNKNGIENFFGTDPTIPSEGVLSVSNVDDNTFTFTHPQNTTPANDLTTSYSWSKDLVTFHADGAENGGTTVSFTAQLNTPSAGITTVTTNVTGTQTKKLFMRVSVQD